MVLRGEAPSRHGGGREERTVDDGLDALLDGDGEGVLLLEGEADAGVLVEVDVSSHGPGRVRRT